MLPAYMYSHIYYWYYESLHFVEIKLQTEPNADPHATAVKVTTIGYTWFDLYGDTDNTNLLCCPGQDTGQKPTETWLLL